MTVPLSLVQLSGSGAAWMGALGDSLWFGRFEFAGYAGHPLVVLFAISGSLMISRIHFPKF